MLLSWGDFQFSVDTAAFDELELSLENSYTACYIDIIKVIEFSDPHVAGLPDLGVDRSGLVLKSQAVICFAGLCLEFLLLFA